MRHAKRPLAGEGRTLAESVLVMVLWGLLFPLVKVGYAAFSIDTSFYPNLLLFAGLRFLVCGAVLTGIAARRKEAMRIADRKSTVGILAVGLFAIVLHYACTYIGLSLTDSSKTALLKQLGVLFFVCFSFLFFKDERFSVSKLLSAAFGLAGMIVLNVGAVGFSFGLGELLIVSASVCTVVSNVFCKKYTAGVSPLIVTAYSQLAGGAVLTAAALLCGGRCGVLSGKSVGVFAAICLCSCVSYVLWNKNVQTGALSRLFVIKFLEPLFAAVFGALLLREDICKPEYLIALILIVAAILTSHWQRQTINVPASGDEK